MVVALVAATARTVLDQRVPVPGRDTWVTEDSDSFYQMRRVDRAIREGHVAGTDPALSFPDGSPIPWPPYYTALVTALVAPFAPDDADGRRAYLERRVASWPCVFGSATSVVAALAAGVIAGPAAALLAGLLHALSPAAIAYSYLGNGDHHAWAALLAGVMLALVSLAFRPGAAQRSGTGARYGAAAGIVAGVALGSWVGSLLTVLLVQITLGVLLVRASRRPVAALAPFGATFHGTAALALLPAVLASPWNAVDPWMVVNLSWFHLAWLGAGALVFVPGLRPMSRAAATRYPMLVAAAIVVVAAVLFGANAGPAAGIRQGFAWIARNDAFMGGVWESRGLLGSHAAFRPEGLLGWGIVALPFAWGWMAWRAFRRRELELLPWAVALPVLTAQAMRQLRFADALTLPMAVAVAWGVVELWKAKRPPLPAPAAAFALVALGLVLDGGTVSRAAGRVTAPDRSAPTSPPNEVTRGLAEWIRGHTPREPDAAVLASWSWGHLIEWVADRPSVATNFGPFVGEEAFRVPARFLLSEDPAEAESLLSARNARWVLVTTWLPNRLTHLAREVDARLESRYVEPDSPVESLRLKMAWYETMGARLLFNGRVARPDGGFGESIDFLRAVHVSKRRDPRYGAGDDARPAGWVWEHVPGAVVEAAGEPGEHLEMQIVIRYPNGYEVVWTRSAAAGSDGTARLRVPYATDSRNGDGASLGPARWRFEGREGMLVIPERAVRMHTALHIDS